MSERIKCETFCKKLLEIKSVRIPCFVLSDNVHIFELQGFSDPAKVAYGAVVYLRCLNNSKKIKVSLL